MALTRLRARETDRRRDWAEKTSTRLAREFDLIRVEKLDIAGMTRLARGTAAEPGRNVRAKSGLNRGIMRSGWGLLVRRLRDKAPGLVEKIDAAFTSVAWRAGMSQRRAARAKPSSPASPAVSPATLM